MSAAHDELRKLLQEHRDYIAKVQQEEPSKLKALQTANVLDFGKHLEAFADQHPDFDTALAGLIVMSAQFTTMFFRARHLGLTGEEPCAPCIENLIEEVIQELFRALPAEARAGFFSSPSNAISSNLH